ncbi:MAG: YlmC/YmxH family sporulation protein [Clostridia bacterium]|nr:YlmC/YmxH family sporulation protein [Clostridia bacterium]
MRKISMSELSEREVINLCGGERLGYPCDFEIDLDDGKILSITVSDSGGWSLFCKKTEYVIPWCKIECIGEDAILIKIPQNELCCSDNGCRTGKKRFMSSK